jgi:hypothetical protein
MSESIVRQKLNFNEIFDISTIGAPEAELPPTENLSNMLSPNWDSLTDKWELGKWNSTYGSSIGLGKIIEMIERQQELILSILDQVVKILAKSFNK